MQHVKGIAVLATLLLLALGLTYSNFTVDYTWQIESIAYNHNSDFMTYMTFGKGFGTFLIFMCAECFTCLLIYLMYKDN